MTNQNYTVKISEIIVNEEYALQTKEQPKLVKKEPKIISIVPKIKNNKKNMQHRISLWYRENRDELNYVFDELITVYYNNGVKFYNNEEYIYDKFVEFMYNNCK